MFGSTDIPDWCQVEAGAGERELQKMFECSPMAHIDNVKTPVLLLIGSVDNRVPVSFFFV